MGKWKITGISLAVLIIAGVIFVNSPWLIAAALYFLQPSESFANTVPPTAPNYNDTAYWASLPRRRTPRTSCQQNSPQINMPSAMLRYFSCTQPLTSAMPRGTNPSITRPPTSALTTG